MSLAFKLHCLLFRQSEELHLRAISLQRLQLALLLLELQLKLTPLKS